MRVHYLFISLSKSYPCPLYIRTLYCPCDRKCLTESITSSFVSLLEASDSNTDESYSSSNNTKNNDQESMDLMRMYGFSSAGIDKGK